MANEIDLYDGGGVQPYAPSQPLAPLSPSPDTWGRTDDLLREDQPRQSGTLFGAALPAGATQQQVTQTLNEIQAVIAGDLMRLGHSQASITAAISWFQSNARKTPVRETKRHNFNLHDQVGDLVAESFGNAMARAGASQEFISNCLWLLGELNKKLGVSQGKPAQGSATLTSGGPLDQLTDQQYNVLVKHNENVKVQTMGRLEQRWGQCFKQNLALAQAHLNKMTVVEIAHFDRYTGAWPWTHFLNSYEGLVGLFEMAIGVNSMPTNGPAIAQEILQIEALMREPATRRAYLKDDALQARYRQLLSLTLGGR